MNSMRIIMNKHLFVVLVGFALLTSCTTPRDIAYFQDVEENQPIQTQNDGYIRFQKGDKLNIYVHSRDEQLKDLFNIVIIAAMLAQFAIGRIFYRKYIFSKKGVDYLSFMPIVMAFSLKSGDYVLMLVLLAIALMIFNFFGRTRIPASSTSLARTTSCSTASFSQL